MIPTNQIAKNGNSYGASDPNFLHFTDEQTGLLLPSCPGYPDWLPQLQLTPTGRLCFWNFPAKLLKSVISNPANQGTSQYLRDIKKVTATNLYPPVPADLGTNGSTNQYLWNSCNTYFKQTTDIKYLFDYNLAGVLYGNLMRQKGSAPSINDLILQIPSMGYIELPIGSFNQLGAWGWIQANAQFYINRYLNIPYDLNSPQPFGKTWFTQLNLASQQGILPSWLNVINLLAQNPPDPSTWDKISTAIPGAILAVVGGVLTLVTAGAATPLLAAAIGNVSNATKTAAATANQGSANSSANLAQITADSSYLSSLPNPLSDLTDQEKEYIFFGLVIVVMAVIIIYITRKK